jgi:hypothetical protein
MDKDIFIIGTDFHHQTLIDKRVNAIFCNPPYSEYMEWVTKIIKEANAEKIYLVIPDRWKSKKVLQQLIEQRKAHYRILGNYDFVNAERQARAKVQLVKIKLQSTYRGEREYELESDPFELWFHSNFKISADKEEVLDFEKKQSRKDKLKELVNGDTLISSLAELYQKDLDKLINHYKTIETLDSDLLKELNINVAGICAALKQKISGLKHLYWRELFDHLNAITDRLTSKSRERLLSTLTSHTSIDFTVSNAYSVVIWSIKNANKYMDEQLKEVYLELSDSQNVKLYKSNNRIIEDGWRYNKSEMTHYKLDYRIIHSLYRCFGDYSFDSEKLNNRAHNLINDIFTIAKNLGFNIQTNAARSRNWTPGKREEFYTLDTEIKLFCDIKAYKNGNIHLRLTPEFMKKFNIEAARLNGWIRSPKEAEEELDISSEEAEKYFNTNYQICANNVKLLS